MAKKGEFLEYKGRPLVRCGNTIYYGSMADPFVVCLKAYLPGFSEQPVLS